ncbi:RNA polymerase sigma factor [Novosphingobium sp. BW1]|uniref:RNA polymerase sigma factor n=1 Tax=Novosphingobium sp. BW1 TaxID=2592621 RepID=UPI0011DE8433|nr:RNA polymerase sigma factor [Novosphingobium sp. BW1]TYC89233.1 RNA polymerase sigma factor [Novosphingobium sp. BW1]
MAWLRDIDSWFLAEVLPHAAAYLARAAHFCGRDEADDLVQEAYARVLGTSDFRAIQAPRSFVLTIVHNLAIERLRRASVVRIDYLASLEVLEMADPTPDAFTVSSARSELTHLLKLIDALPPQCGRVLHMRKIQGMAPAQIAEALSISLSTVEKHLAKGLALVTRARRDNNAGLEVACSIVPNSKRLATT